MAAASGKPPLSALTASRCLGPLGFIAVQGTARCLPTYMWSTHLQLLAVAILASGRISAGCHHNRRRELDTVLQCKEWEKVHDDNPPSWRLGPGSMLWTALGRA